MPSFTIHLIIPLLFLLALRRFDPRKVWFLLPFTLVPDIDYFFGFHRATLGNLFILLPPLALYAWSVWRPHHRPIDDLPPVGGAREWALIAFIYMASHLLMDLFAGGIVPFYPLSDWTACLYGYIEVETATNTPHLYFGDCSRPGIPRVVDVYPWLDYDETAMLVFVGLGGLLAGFARRGRRPS